MPTPAPDTLLHTKLHPPPPPSRPVSRPRLPDRLDAGRCGVVTGPDGCGKSTLLGDWAHRDGRRVAWVTLEPGDATLRQVFTCVVEALRRQVPGFGDALREILHAPRRPEAAAVKKLLARELGRLERDLVLVLDDYQVVTDPEVHRTLAEVFDPPPPRLRLALATSAAPPADFVRWRTAGAVELGEADLRFTAAESEDFLNRTLILGLTRPEAEALGQAAGGWAAGLRMAALALHGDGGDRGRLLAELCARRLDPEPAALDEITGRILEGRSPEVRRFLLHTSVLRRLTAPLCDVLAGRDDSRILLEELEAAHFFLIPLDAERRWYRYHPVFGESLHRQLERREGPERVAELHGRASDWFAAEHPEQALVHAREAASVERAARILGRAVRPLLVRGRAETVWRWFGLLPAEWIEGDPRLVIDRALMCFMTLRWRQFERELERAERLLEQTGDLTLRSEMTALRALLGYTRSDWRTTCDMARQALAALPKKELYLRGLVIHVLGHALIGLGEEDAAWRAFARSVDWNITCGNRLVALVAKCALGWMEMTRGRYHESFATHKKALKLVTGEGEAHSSGSLALAGLAEIHREWADSDQALELAREAVELGRHAFGMGFLRGLLTLARVDLSRGEIDAAGRVVGEAERVVKRTRMTVWAGLVEAHRARVVLVRQRHGGDPAELGEVRGWAEAAGFVDSWDPLTDPLTVHFLADHPRDYAVLTFARLLIAERQWGQALLLLETLEGFALKVQWERSRIECLALRALVYTGWAADGGGEEQADRGVRRVSEALALASSEGLIAVFSDEGTPMAELVERALSRARPPFKGAYFDKLRSALGEL